MAREEKAAKRRLKEEAQRHKEADERPKVRWVLGCYCQKCTDRRREWGRNEKAENQS